MTDDSIRIQIQILNRSYPITIRRSEEEAVRAAAKNITDMLSRMQRAYNIDQPQDLLAMVAIQLATKVEKLETLREHEQGLLDDYSKRFHLLMGSDTAQAPSNQ